MWTIILLPHSVVTINKLTFVKQMPGKKKKCSVKYYLTIIIIITCILIIFKGNTPTLRKIQKSLGEFSKMGHHVSHT